MKRESENLSSDLSKDNLQPKELKPEDISRALGSPEDVRERIGEELAPIEAKNKETTESAKEQRTERFERNVQALKGLTDQTEAQATKKGYNGPLSRLAEIGRRYIGVALLSMVAAGCGTSTKSEYSSKDRPAATAAGHQDSTVAGKRERNRERIRQRTEEWRQKKEAEKAEKEKKILKSFQSFDFKAESIGDGTFSVDMGEGIHYKVGQRGLDALQLDMESYDRRLKRLQLISEGTEVGEEELKKETKEHMKKAILKYGKKIDSAQFSERSEEKTSAEDREELVRQIIETLQTEAGQKPETQPEYREAQPEKTMREEVKEEIDEAAEKQAVDIARRTGKDLQDIRRQLGLGQKKTGRVIMGSRGGAPSRETGEPTPQQYEDAYRSFREKLESATKPLENKIAQQLVEKIQNQLEINQGALEAGEKMLDDKSAPEEEKESVKTELEKILEMSKNLLGIRDNLKSGGLSTKDATDQINRLERIGNSVILQKIERQREAQQKKEEAEKRSRPDRSDIARLLSGFLNIPVTENLDSGSVSLKVNVIDENGKGTEKEYKINPENFGKIKKIIETAQREEPGLSEKQRQQQKKFAKRAFGVVITQIGEEIKEKNSK